MRQGPKETDGYVVSVDGEERGCATGAWIRIER